MPIHQSANSTARPTKKCSDLSAVFLMARERQFPLTPALTTPPPTVAVWLLIAHSPPPMQPARKTPGRGALFRSNTCHSYRVTSCQRSYVCPDGAWPSAGSPAYPGTALPRRRIPCPSASPMPAVAFDERHQDAVEEIADDTDRDHHRCKVVVRKRLACILDGVAQAGCHAEIYGRDKHDPRNP